MSGAFKGRGMAGIWFLIMILIICHTGEARSEFPESSISLVVPYDPGGAMDTLARTIALGAERQLGKPIVVENKGGGGGAVGLALVANSKPDGYTLCAAANVTVVDAALMQKVTFKPLKSFTPILGHSLAEHTALIVKSDTPWKSFKEFIDYAKANPGKIKYSTAGVGMGMHMAMEVISRKEGIKWVHVPYKGSAPATVALLGGHVDACSAGLGWQTYARSGDVRVLADHGKTRSAEFPDVPTLWELGYGFSNDTIHAIVGPAGIPPDVRKKLEEAFKKAMETPEFKTAQEQFYVAPVYYVGDEYERHLQERWVAVEKIMKEAGIITEAATSPR
jgi:tripartite-type tricarboxylate transporter receptor subunit TctC